MPELYVFLALLSACGMITAGIWGLRRRWRIRREQKERAARTSPAATLYATRYGGVNTGRVLVKAPPVLRRPAPADEPAPAVHASRDDGLVTGLIVGEVLGAAMATASRAEADPAPVREEPMVPGGGSFGGGGASGSYESPDSGGGSSSYDSGSSDSGSGGGSSDFGGGGGGGGSTDS